MNKIRPFRSERRPSGAGRGAVLAALRTLDGPVTVQALAERLGLHANTVRFHLMKLVQAGLVEEERGTPTGPGRPRMRYRTTGASAALGQDTGSPAEYQLLAHILAGHLAASAENPDEAAQSAGRQWGQYLIDRPPPFDRPDNQKIRARVAAMFDRLGFQPEVRESGEIWLRRCPFREVAERQPNVVCSVHLGLSKGAIAELGGEPEQTTLEPFVTPQRCVVRLGLVRHVHAGTPDGVPVDAPNGVPAQRRASD